MSTPPTDTVQTPLPALLPLPRGVGHAQFNEAMRICPYVFLRSTVFGVTGKGKRKYFDDALLASTDEFTVRFIGLQLDQTDLDVWLELVHLLKYQPVGSTVNTSHVQLLTVLGKADSGQNRQALKQQLTRLHTTAVKVFTASGSYVGSLIDAAESGKALEIRLDPRIVELFAGKRFTRMQHAVRSGLTPMGKWLYGYFSTHIQPPPICVDEIQRLCGSNATNLDAFRYSLRSTLKQLKRACDANDERFNWRIDRAGVLHADWIGSKKHVRWSQKVSTTSSA